MKAVTAIHVIRYGGTDLLGLISGLENTGRIRFSFFLGQFTHDDVDVFHQRLGIRLTALLYARQEFLPAFTVLPNQRRFIAVNFGERRKDAAQQECRSALREVILRFFNRFIDLVTEQLFVHFRNCQSIQNEAAQMYQAALRCRTIKSLAIGGIRDVPVGYQHGGACILQRGKNALVVAVAEIDVTDTLTIDAGS